MRNSQRILIATITLAVAGTFLSESHVNAHDGFSLLNPLRRNSPSTNDSERSVFSSSDYVKSSDQHIDRHIDREFGTSLLSTDQLSGSSRISESPAETKAAVGQSPLALNQITTPQSKSRTIDQPITAWDSSERQFESHLAQRTLPPTLGRFVQSEQSWVFVPDDPTSLSVEQHRDQRLALMNNNFRIAATIKDLSGITQTKVDLVPNNPLRDQTSAQFLLSQTNSRIKTDESSIQILVTDNLMLERVVTMPHHRPGQTWEVSGLITRVDQHLQLDIRTAEPR